MTAPTKAPPTDTGRCGETTGYKRHKARDEQPCQPCLDADNAYRRQMYRDRAAQRGSQLFAPLPSAFGRFAGVWAPHAFRQLHPSMGSTQCLECFGWIDDVRHL